MTFVTAVIKAVRTRRGAGNVAGIGRAGHAVSKSSGDGRRRGHTEVYRGAEYTVELLLKVLLEVREVLVDGVGRGGRLAPVTMWLIDKSRGVGVVSGCWMQQPAGTDGAARRAAPS